MKLNVSEPVKPVTMLFKETIMKKWISKFGLVGMMSLLLFSFTGMATEVNTANDALWQTNIVAEMHGDHAEMPVEEPAAAEEAPTLSAGDTAWMIVATILVLVMAIPGLALFYGGLVRSKNMLCVLLQDIVTFSPMSVRRAVLGDS
jgi:Amt family ammonium transporter